MLPLTVAATEVLPLGRGSGAKLAAEKLVDTILTHAARTYKLPKDELRLASEQIWHRDSAVCTLAQLCTYINFVNDQKTDTDHITAEATFTMKNICLAYGVSFMDLEVDVPVGKVKIRKVYCLQDSGGRVAVYTCRADGTPGTLIRVTGIYTNLLPENDALRIKRGLVVNSPRELDLLLEDLGE